MKLAAIALMILAAGCAAPVVGLKPIPPERVFSYPELQWEPLPGNAFGSRFLVEEVRYDLRVFDGRLLIYSRDGLSEPRHRVEEKLIPGKAYSWTVRARFRVDGARRRTDWTQKESSERRDGSLVQEPARLLPLKIEPLPKP